MNAVARREIGIVADYREAGSAALLALGSMDGVRLSLRHLRVGDYLIDNRLLVERKTLPDLARSIQDGRLFRQARRLGASAYATAILLEGSAADLAGNGMSREAIQGAIISVTLLLGIPLLRALDGRESARAMVYAARQLARAAHGGLPNHNGRRPRGKRRTQLALLQGLPGVGPQRAEQLLARFGSVEAVVQADTDDLARVPGVGPKTAKAIRWAVSEAAPIPYLSLPPAGRGNGRDCNLKGLDSFSAVGDPWPPTPPVPDSSVSAIPFPSP